jgi:hypothetical protein
MSKSTSSRRAVLAGAVTIPIASAVTTLALADTEDAELRRLGAEVKAAYDALGVVLDAIDEPDQESIEWQQCEGEAWDKLRRAIHGLCQTPART